MAPVTPTQINYLAGWVVMVYFTSGNDYGRGGARDDRASGFGPFLCKLQRFDYDGRLNLARLLEPELKVGNW